MTTSEKKTLSKVVQHELALKVYIDALLDEPETEVVTETNIDTRVEANPKVAVTKPKLEAPVTEASPIRPEVVAQPVTKVEHVEETQTSDEPEGEVSDVKDIYPAWAKKEFEVLMFKVGGGLNLATPLVELTTILNWSNHITAVPGHAEWFLGLLQTRQHQVKVILP